LRLDIAALKHDSRTHIRWLPGAPEFVSALRAAGKHLMLVTNAHHDSLRIKDAHAGLAQHFDTLISSHSYGYPKEHATFWQRFHREHVFNPSRSMFIDDSLPVLRAARSFGIGAVVAVTHPDSTQPPHECTEFPAVKRVADLTPSLSALQTLTA
jgi:HAD superfamily hydrolase (TIGR01509 family)